MPTIDVSNFYSSPPPRPVVPGGVVPPPSGGSGGGGALSGVKGFWSKLPTWGKILVIIAAAVVIWIIWHSSGLGTSSSNPPPSSGGNPPPSSGGNPPPAPEYGTTPTPSAAHHQSTSNDIGGTHQTAAQYAHAHPTSAGQVVMPKGYHNSTQHAAGVKTGAPQIRAIPRQMSGSHAAVSHPKAPQVRSMPANQQISRFGYHTGEAAPKPAKRSKTKPSDTGLYGAWNIWRPSHPAKKTTYHPPTTGTHGHPGVRR